MTREAIAKELIEGIQKYLESIKMKKEFKVGDRVRFRFDDTPKRTGVIADICHASNPITIAVKDAEGVIYTAIPSYLKKVKDKQPKLLPFNLDEALAGKAVVTRDGTPIVKFYQDGDSALVNFPYRGTDGQATHEYTGMGTYHEDGKKDHRDLFMKPEPKKKKTYWVNVYSDMVSNEKAPIKRDFYIGCEHYNTKEEAYAKRGAMSIKTIKIKL